MVKMQLKPPRMEQAHQGAGNVLAGKDAHAREIELARKNEQDGIQAHFDRLQIEAENKDKDCLTRMQDLQNRASAEVKRLQTETESKEKDCSTRMQDLQDRASDEIKRLQTEAESTKNDCSTRIQNLQDEASVETPTVSKAMLRNWRGGCRIVVVRAMRRRVKSFRKMTIIHALETQLEAKTDLPLHLEVKINRISHLEASNDRVSQYLEADNNQTFRL